MTNSFLKNWDASYDICKKIRDLVLKNKDIPNLKSGFKVLQTEYLNAQVAYRGISKSKNRLEILHYTNIRLITALNIFIKKLNPQLLREGFSELQVLAEEYNEAFELYNNNTLFHKFHVQIQSLLQNNSESKIHKDFLNNLLLNHKKLLEKNQQAIKRGSSIQNYLNQLLSEKNITTNSNFLDTLDTIQSRILIIKKKYTTYQSSEEKAYELFKFLMKQYDIITNNEYQENKLLKYYHHFMKELAKHAGYLQKDLISVTKHFQRIFEYTCKKSNIESFLDLIQEKHTLLSTTNEYLKNITLLLNSSETYNKHHIHNTLKQYFHNCPNAYKDIFSTIENLNTTYLKQYYSIKQPQIKEVLFLEYQLLVYIYILQYGVQKLSLNKTLFRAYIAITYYKFVIFNDNQDSLLYNKYLHKLDHLVYSKELETIYRSFNQKLSSKPKKFILKREKMLNLINILSLLNYNLLSSTTYLSKFLKHLQVELDYVSKQTHFESHKQIGRIDINCLTSTIYKKALYGEKRYLIKLSLLSNIIDPNLAKDLTQNLQEKYNTFLNLTLPQQQMLGTLSQAA